MAPRRGEEEGREEGQRRGWAGLGWGCPGSGGARAAGNCRDGLRWATGKAEGRDGQGCGRYGCDDGDRVAGILEAARTTSGIIARAVAVSLRSESLSLPHSGS